jgi:general secretion pathway protein D
MTSSRRSIARSLALGLLLAGLAAAPRAQEGPADAGPGPSPFFPPPAQFGGGPADTGADTGGPDAGLPADGVDLGFGTTVPSDAVIRYDPQTDSIIVIGDETTNLNIQRVIETMDKPIPQVLIKVLFLEVTHTKSRDLGVQGTLTHDSLDVLDTIATNFGVAAGGTGGSYHILDEDFEVTIKALETIGKLEVLSRPSVLARNNQTAIITIGQEVPFIRNTRITDNGQQINTIEYEDIGIILEVTPHITAERLVEMYVAPEISTLTAETVPISDTVNARVIAKRAAETTVVVGDGRTVVIGGLMEDNETETVTKVPILGDIPLIGLAFRRTIKTKVKTELLIFLTPYVVDTPSSLQAMSASEHNQATLPPRVFSPDQYDKFVDNLGEGVNEWKGDR